MDQIIQEHLDEHIKTVSLIKKDFAETINNIAQECISTLKNGGKILLCGNGGSAADAQHIAAELVVRYKENREALASLALTTDTSILTACANDFGYESVFSRQVEALGCKGDILIGITTSGTSKNILKALTAAQNKGIKTVAFCGQNIDALKQTADYIYNVPSYITAHIQECHLLAGHIICDLIEKAFTQN